LPAVDAAESAETATVSWRAMEMLKNDAQMRHEFVGIVADQVVDKLIQCGMIP
jgi:hypothetical protein